jgi:hypothetical protein
MPGMPGIGNGGGGMPAGGGKGGIPGMGGMPGIGGGMDGMPPGPRPKPPPGWLCGSMGLAWAWPSAA